MRAISDLRRALAAFGAAALIAAFVAAPAAAENPCVEGNPMAVSDVSGFSWVGHVLSVDESRPLEPVYEIAVKTVYAGESDDLKAGDTVTIASRQCFRIVRLDRGADYLMSVPIFPNPDGTYGSAYFAAWKLSRSSAAFVLMHPGRPVDAAFAGARTLASALALVAPGAQLPETDTVRGFPARPSTEPSILWLSGAISAALAVLVAFRRRRASRHSSRPRRCAA